MLELPESLKRYTVEQAYDRYDAADQATWRFVMLHLYEHLRQHAHPSYVRGLPATGLSVDHIPLIEAIDEALEPLNWRAVPISGFIPPRAFQGFQAAGVLPIATEIRTPEHLAYTPAPDIIHEAAGHAPILVNPEYGEYLRRAGRVSQAAFSSPQDVAVYDAIAALSALKEQPAATPEQVAAAERRLQNALASQQVVSESTRMARLYWWTAEYGLLGSPHDFCLYGAGLLSSLGEAHHCRGASVKKLPLSIEALDVDYDITQPQPQLFVARDFDHLMQVLDEAQRQLAAFGPLAQGLKAAAASRLPARLNLGSGLCVEGVLEDFAETGGAVDWLLFNGPCTYHHAPHWQHFGQSLCPNTANLRLPLGKIRLIRVGAENYSPDAFDRRIRSALSPLPSQLTVHFQDGTSVEATLVGFARPIPSDSETIDRSTCCAKPAMASLHLRNAVVRQAGLTGSGLASRYEELVLPLGVTVESVRPADDDPSLPASPSQLSRLAESSPEYQAAVNNAQTHQNGETSRRAPLPKALPPKQQALRQLFSKATNIWHTTHGAEAVRLLNSIHRQLSDFPEDWLLRWNLLESLIKLGAIDRTSSLIEELEALEVTHQHQQPIATGLRSLRMLAQSTAEPPQPHDA